MPLTSEQSQLFNKYERLFVEDGWKELVEDLTERREALKERLLADPRVTEKDLYLSQGMATVYSYIIGLEKIMDTAKRQALESQEFMADVTH